MTKLNLMKLDILYNLSKLKARIVHSISAVVIKRDGVGNVAHVTREGRRARERHARRAYTNKGVASRCALDERPPAHRICLRSRFSLRAICPRVFVVLRL